MPLRYLLCHTCWTWVAPSGLTCPLCHVMIDITQRDPDADELSRIFGQFVVRIATVHLEHSQLPNHGSLLGTSQGLLFLPFLRTLADGAFQAVTRPGPQWRGWWSWPFSSVRAFPVRRLIDRGETTAAIADEADLASLFLNAPGSQFVSCEQTSRLHVRGQQLSIARTRGPQWRCRLLSPPEEWRPAWRQLGDQTPLWRVLIPRSRND